MAGGEECPRDLPWGVGWDEGSGHESQFHVCALGRAMEGGERWDVAEGHQEGALSEELGIRRSTDASPPPPHRAPFVLLHVFPAPPPCTDLSSLLPVCLMLSPLLSLPNFVPPCPLPTSCRRPLRGTPSLGCSSVLPSPASGAQLQLGRTPGACPLPRRPGACLRMELGLLGQGTGLPPPQRALCPPPPHSPRSRWLQTRWRASWRSWSWWRVRGRRRSWLTSCRAPVCDPLMRRMRTS